MMKYYFGVWRSIFVEAGVPLTVIALTMGEVGIPSHWSTVTPIEMKNIRREEFLHSLQSIGAMGISLDYPDLHVSLTPIEPVVQTTLKTVRDNKFGVLFSFHPNEVTPLFDHPDHNTAGVITKIVAAAADVKHFYPEYPAMQKRPELYVWTTDTHTATHKLPLPKAARERRNTHLVTHYPSQFSRENQSEWTVIFDRITHGNHKHRELYLKIR